MEVFAAKGSQRFPKCRRRMFGNELIFVVDPPGPIEELSDFHFGLGIGSSLWAWGNIQNQSSNANGVVIADHRRIAKVDDAIQVQILRDLSPGGVGVPGRHGKATIKPPDEGL